MIKTYQIFEVEDIIKVHPSDFNLGLEEAIKVSIAKKHEGRIDAEIGIVLAVVSVSNIGESTLLPGDPSVHYPTSFRLLTWLPYENEILEGEIVDATEWGAFIRVGPVDGLVHISQVMDDFVSYDEKNRQLAGKSSRRILKVGDDVRSRVISINLKEQTKLGLTMRQPYLGKRDWIKVGTPEKTEKSEAGEERKAKPKGKKRRR